MKKKRPKKYTEEDLCKNFWWWRRGDMDWDFANEDFTTKMKSEHGNPRWKNGLERAIWKYELAGRDEGNLEPVKRMSVEEYTWYEGIFCNIKTGFVIINDDGTASFGGERQKTLDVPKEPFAQGEAVIDRFDLSEMVEVGRLYLDLSLTDEALAAEFKSVLAAMRPATKNPRQQRAKSPSWRWPELMDISRYKVRVLNDSERSILSSAKAEAKSSVQRMKEFVFEQNSNVLSAEEIEHAKDKDGMERTRKRLESISMFVRDSKSAKG